MEGRGLIGFSGLTDWWDSELSESERSEIRKTYAPLGGSGPLDSGFTVRYDSQGELASKINILNSLLNADCSYEIKKKIADKALSLSPEKGDVIDLHFLFHSIITYEYKHRDTQAEALDRAIKACECQIALATKAKAAFKRNSLTDGFLPSHPGYKQLAIIFEKQKAFSKVIKLCEKALKQGWSGDWQNRIDRCTKKLNK